ncbi:DUF4325 domain-containing protein [Vibrio splendidus]
MKMYNIGLQFDDEPASRYFKDTQGRSAEVFRERVLKPLLIDNYNDEVIVFIIDAPVEGYGSSFLTESFAGLVKYGYIKAEQLEPRLKFAYKDSIFSFYASRIRSFIRKSAYQHQAYGENPDSSPEDVKGCLLPPNIIKLSEYDTSAGYILS